MKIKNMFANQIDRHITGVIKVGQIDDEDKKQEMEEYVITREVGHHFTTFFDNYARSIKTPSDEIGVWISGFFGSGKSHFLKILSYILDDEEIGGKKAIEYFKAKDQVKSNPMLLANMQLTSQTPTKAILFNVDSKSTASAKTDSNAIVNVFNRVFNEKLGYEGANPALADLERNLDYEGHYDEFKKAYKEIAGDDWLQDRRRFRIRRGKVVDTLVKIGYMDRPVAETWSSESTSDNYKLASEDFAKRVENYIERTNNRVVFLADEIGQFIASDSNLMLNLQTITEDLGTYCKGKAWVIVTAQEDIDSMMESIHDRSNDFSKIQGRFTTRLSLSSVNVDEVIRERILKKNNTGRETLEALYETQETTIKNVVDFRDTPEMKRYTSAQDFADVYPFLPYQFNLLQNVLNAIRRNSATGKHLSEGERSMLGAYQQAAISVMDNEEGTLIPFYRFYDNLVKFLDHTHSIVIQRASDNERINPNHEEDNFNVNVLKTLFLLKYIDSVPLTVNNIVSFMVTDIESDRIELKQKVEDALGLLIREAVVSQIQDRYEFLTDEEQDIRRAIESTEVSSSDVIGAIASIVTDSIYTETRYRYDKFNGKYTFGFNFAVDDRQIRTNQEIGLRIITPKYSGNIGSANMAMAALTSSGKEGVIRLPDNNTSYYKDLLTHLKIKKYLRTVADPNKGRSTVIRSSVSQEADTDLEEAIKALKDAIGEGDVFVGNSLVTDIKTNDAFTKIKETLGKVVSRAYFKLENIVKSKDEGDIRDLIRKACRNEKQSSLMEDLEDNPAAYRDVKEYLNMVTNPQAHENMSLRTLADHYKAIPYGFIDNDIHWIVAKLFCDGVIDVTFEKIPLSLFKNTADDLSSYFSEHRYEEKIQMRIKVTVDAQSVKIAKDISKDLFNATVMTDAVDRIMAEWKGNASNLLGTCKEIKDEINHNPDLPGKEAIDAGINLLNLIMREETTDGFFAAIKGHKDGLCDLIDDLPPVKSFYNSKSQMDLFVNKGLKAVKLFDSSKEYISDNEIKEDIDNIRSIVTSKNPYDHIKQIPALYDSFIQKYSDILEKQAAVIKPIIEQDKNTLINTLADKSYKEKYNDDIISNYNDLLQRVDSENDLSLLLGYKDKSSSLCSRYMNQFNSEESACGAMEGSESKVKRKSLMARDITSQNWHITSEEQLDSYIEGLRKRLKDELSDNDEIEVRF